VAILQQQTGGVTRGGKRGWGADNKTCLFRMIERGAQVLVIPVEKRNATIILPLIQEHAEPGLVVNTDKFQVYNGLRAQIGHPLQISVGAGRGAYQFHKRLLVQPQEERPRHLHLRQPKAATKVSSQL
jgi:transposase-like protein